MNFVKQIEKHLKTDPFPYAVVQGIFPSKVYDELAAKLPSPLLVVNGRPQKENILLQYHAAQVLRDARIAWEWGSIFATHVGKYFFNLLDEAVGLSTLYPELEKSKHSVGIRYADPREIQMDAIFAVNTPVTKKGTVKGPHLDNPKEIYACLCYFPVHGDKAGGDLTLYRYKVDQPKFYGARFCDDVEAFATVPYEPNTAVFFVNTPRSLHGVTPRMPTEEYRRYVNFECEYHKPLFAIPGWPLGVEKQ